ncbi:hypothetical protein CRG98_040968 [Punica granatum]|nr:hypothetical protein CRG98_040968 [Punica granatum]
MASSGEYHHHLSKMVRTPSVLPNVPHYPNVHRAFNKPKVAHHGEGDVSSDSNEVKQPESHGHNKGGKHSLQFEDEVEVIEYKEEEHTASPASRKKEAADVHGESVDSKADGYIQRKHQKFELCKWATFKVH